MSWRRSNVFVFVVQSSWNLKKNLASVLTGKEERKKERKKERKQITKVLSSS